MLLAQAQEVVNTAYPLAAENAFQLSGTPVYWPMIIGGVIMAASLVGYIVLWFIALIGAIKRTDLKHERIIWILLTILVGPLGMIVYFFMENRKRYGVFTILTAVGLFLGWMTALFTSLTLN